MTIFKLIYNHFGLYYLLIYCKFQLSHMKESSKAP